MRPIALVFLAACVISFPPLSAQALTIIDNDVAVVISEHRTVRASYTKGGDVVFEHTESGTPATPLAVFAETSVTDMLDVASLPTGPGSIRAVITPGGASLIQIEARLNDSLTDAPHVLRGEVVETTVIEGRRTGTYLGPYDLTFDYLIENVFLELWDYAGIDAVDAPDPFLEESPAIGLRVLYEVLVDGERTPPGAMAWVWGGDQEFTGVLYAGFPSFGPFDSGPAFYWGADFGVGPGLFPAGVQFPDVGGGGIVLGGIRPDEIVEITVRMLAEMVLPPLTLDAGGRINIGDPNALEGVFGTIRVSPAGDSIPAPSPATSWLLSLGILALAALRRQTHLR